MATSDTGADRCAHRYAAFGLKLASELALPELDVFRADFDSQNSDVTVRKAAFTMPSQPGDASAAGLQVQGGVAYLAVPQVANYRMQAGRTLDIDILPDASSRMVRLFLLGSALGVICHQRGLLPLHANAIIVDGQAVAFSGYAGVGKSTLAAHFQAAGYDVLCDDVCVISFDAEKRPLAWPGLPRIKLWRDAAENFGHQSMELERVIDGKDKFNVPLRRPVANRPIPLAGFYVLSDWVPGQPETITRLTGSTAMQAAMSNTYRKNYLSKMKLMRENFLQAAILTRRIGIFSAPRRRGFDIFAQEAGKLEKHFRETLFSTIEGSDPVRSNNKLGVSLV